MSDLTGRTQNNTYKDLLHLENSNLGFDGTLRQIESGNGIGSALSLSTIGAAIAGTLAVSGAAAFTVTPNVGGNEMWHAGNDGSGSGLDADTLQGLLPSVFLTETSTPSLSGLWTFENDLFLSRANNTELLKFNDTSNSIQMRVIFDTNLDFSLVPGTSDVFDDTKRLRYDSSLTRWVFDSNLMIAGLFETQAIGATVSSGAKIKDGGSVDRDVGFNVMAPVEVPGATTLTTANVGAKLNYSGAGGSAWTVASDASTPVGATWVVSNIGTGSFTMDTTGITLTWLDGSGALAVGTRTVAIAGIATVTKRALGQYEIWGAGLT